MTVGIGLMGFGRIGRNVFRILQGRTDFEVRAIADVADPAGLTYLLKYDSIYGRFPAAVSYADGQLNVDGRSLSFTNARQPDDAAWADHGVALVVDTTGRYATDEAAKGHLQSGASKVVVASAPGEQAGIPLLLRGINDQVLTPDTPIVALGSNTSNALAPILRILDNSLGVERAFFTTVHAMTRDQRLADVPGDGFRDSRAAAENIIPAETNSPDILVQAMPEFTGKLSAIALNVPVADGSTVDLTAIVAQPTSKEAVNAAIEAAAGGRFLGLIEYSTDPIVSSDVRATTYSGVFDSLATIVIDETMVKVITWFNNGWGYSARIVEVLETMADHLGREGK